MKPILAMTMGDPAGIGAECCVRAAAHRELYDWCRPLVVGDLVVLMQTVQGVGAAIEVRPVASPEEIPDEPGVLPVICETQLETGTWQYGVASAACGEASYQYICKSIELALEGRVDAVVTAPISKEALHMAGRMYAGHTEIFGEKTQTRDFAMVLHTDKLNVIHVTTHVSMRQACDLISRDRVLRVIRMANRAVQEMGVEKPRIAVAGLNAHASENGLFGAEETESIIPAVEAARAEAICVEGPLPPDTVFVKALGGLYDIVVAMYHDQGHIPVKLSGFKLDAQTNRFLSMQGVNMTVGLPIIRTSVDHGTAYDRAGKWLSNEQSMIDAMEMAARIAQNRNRKNH